MTTYNSIIRSIAKRAGELSAMPDDELRAFMLDNGSFPVDFAGTTRAQAIEKRIIAESCLADDFSLPDNPYWPS